MWEWDSTLIHFDQTCWYYDGVDNCDYTIIVDPEIVLFTLHISRNMPITLTKKATKTFTLLI